MERPKLVVIWISSYRIIESFKLEKVLEVIESNHKPYTVKSITKPCPQEIDRSLSTIVFVKVFCLILCQFYS